MTFLFILFIVLVGGGWLLGKSVGGALFPDKSDERITYVDRSIHHHYHEHKNINIIDDVTKKKIFELNEYNKKSPN